MDEVVRQQLINLDLIANISNGEKLITGSGDLFDVEDGSWYSLAPITRRLRGDTREKNFAMIDKLIRTTKTNIDKNTYGDEVTKKLVRKIIQTKKGLENLLLTYQGCKQSKSTLKTSMDLVDDVIKKFPDEYQDEIGIDI